MQTSGVTAKCFAQQVTIYTPIQIWKIKTVTLSLQYSCQATSAETLRQ